MSSVIIGTIAFDTLQTPRAQGDQLLGGSAVYAGLAARLVSDNPIGLVSIIGQDFPDAYQAVLNTVDTTGVVRSSGKTFHWSGEYRGDMSQAITRQTALNVLTEFDPQVPAAFRKNSLIFCANNDPESQSRVLDQCDSPTYIVLDTMNFWIETKRDALLDVLKRVNLLIINDQELLELTQETSVMLGLASVLAYGPQAVIVKKGENGALFYDRTHTVYTPAYPIKDLIDPTGAGDTFAGGFIGVLDRSQDYSLTGIKRAMITGTILAGITVQHLGTAGLQTTKRADLDLYYKQYYQYAGLPPMQ